MKLHADRASGLNAVTAYGDGWVEVNGQRHQGNIVLMPEGEVSAWPVGGFDSLTAGDFEALLARGPELVILGTGARQRFAHPRLTATLAAVRVGVESMDTPAACRTYNILMAEGRRVLAALFAA